MAKKRITRSSGGRHRVERAERQQKMLIRGAAIILGSVIALVVGGALFEEVFRPGLVLATVGEEEITIREFESRVKFERTQWVGQFQQIQSTLQFVGDNPALQQQFQDQMQQIATLLDPVTFADAILTQMIDDRLVRKEARLLGITVTEKEIDEALLSRYGYFPGGTPTTAPTITLQATSAAPSKLYEFVTATSTSTITPTFTVTPEFSATPKPISTSGIFTVTPTTVPTETPDVTATSVAPSATPTVVTTVIAGEQMQAELTRYINYEFDEVELRRLIEFNLYREKVFNFLIDEVEKNQEQVWIRRIEFSTEEDAAEALEKLEAGEDWTVVVDEYTALALITQENDIGWIANYAQDPEFQIEFIKAIFNLDFGAFSQVTETNSGWTIVQILGKEVRQLTSSQMVQINQTLFLVFLERIREETETTIRNNWESRAPTEPNIQSAAAVPSLLP